MERKILIVFAFLLLVPGVEGITTYDITVEGSSILVNTTFELYTSDPGEKVNYWKSTFTLPPRSTIISISDSKGKITEYNFTDNVISFETNSGGRREKEVVSVLFRSNDIVDTTYSPLKRMNISLAAFGDQRPDLPDEKTFVTVNVNNIISYTSSLGFVSQEGESEVTFAGDGPASITLNFGRGEEYDHFILFGGANISLVDNMYGIIPAVTGFVPKYKRFPVIVLDDEEYNTQVNDWSEGQFSSGVILIRRSVVSEPTFPGVLLHEATHGFNEHALRWDNTRVTWFDEGVAQYVEFLANQQLRVREPEIFGDPVKWVEGFKVFTLPPRSSGDELWNYYVTSMKFMEGWNPKESQTREFGYAFGELMVREFVMGGGNLHEVFNDLFEIEETIGDISQKNAVILELLDSDFKPCYSSSRTGFDECIEEINDMEPDVPENVTIDGEVTEIIIPEIDAPEEDPLLHWCISGW